MAVLHCSAGPRLVKVKTTRVPSAQTLHGARRFPTRYKVFYANRWCRVWQHSDGTRYVTNAYVRYTVEFLPGDTLICAAEIGPTSRTCPRGLTCRQCCVAPPTS